MTVDQALAQLAHTGYLAVRRPHRYAIADQIGTVIALVFVLVAGPASLVRLPLRLGGRTRVLIMSGKKGKSVPLHLELDGEEL